MDWLKKIMKDTYSYKVGSGIDGYSIVDAVAAERAKKLYYKRQEKTYNSLRTEEIK